MLAKPEYSSPPDEVCCWQGRRSGAADRRCGGAFAGLGAAAELLTSWGAVAKLLAGAPQWQRCCWQGRRSGAAGRGAVAELLAGWGAVAKRQAGNAAVAKRLLAGGAAAE